MIDAKALNILLVEDDRVDAMNIRRALEKGNVANPIFTASDGVEALEMLRGSAIPVERRLILLDLDLPRMNGIEFLREVRKDPALQPVSVVILTTSVDERDKIEAYELNVAGYLLKPVTFSKFVELMATIKSYWALVEMP
jgi:CheY-like chemotaxis protein